MWNDVELLINEDTNTGRLCNVREENSGLYQVDTLVKIASTEKVRPKVVDKLNSAIYVGAQTSHRNYRARYFVGC